MNTDHTHRLYFALWPDDELRARLRKIALEVAARAGGEPIPADQLHVTLAHLGDIRAARLAEVRKLAADIAFERVEIEFTRVEYWPEVKLASLVCDRRPEALVTFVRALHGALRCLGLFKHEFEYHPHVSIVQEVERNVIIPLPRPLYWRADHFVLAEMREREAFVEHEVIDAWEGVCTRALCV